MFKKLEIRRGDIITTSMRDEAIIVDYDGENALLIKDNMYLVAHNIYINNGKYEWENERYTDSLKDAFLTYNSDFEKRIDLMRTMAEDDYGGYIKGLMAVEYGDIDAERLDKIVDNYMEDDGIYLLSDTLNDQIVKGFENGYESDNHSEKPICFKKDEQEVEF